MRGWIRDWLIGFIIKWIVVGGHCGLCGKWIDHVLVPSYWRVAICDDCIKEYGDDD